MVEKKITIKDVAREANVSISTVSRYLNNNFSSMGKETKERIQRIIHELNYQPNKLAQGLKGQSRTIAVIVVNISYPFCVAITRSISNVLDESGYSLIVCETGGDTKKEFDLLHSLAAQGVDGIILQTNGQNNDVLEEFSRTFPILLVDRYFDIPGVKNVITDNKKASYQLTNSLFAEGYKRVYFVSEKLLNLSTRVDRYEGYMEACSMNKKDPFVYWVDLNKLESMQAVIDAFSLRTEDEPFAIYTSHGLLMLQLYPLLNKLSLRVPEVLGLATFDEPDWVRITNPALTCVRQPTYDMGQLAANMILDRLRGDIKPHLQPSVQVLPSTVILSSSTSLQQR